jgi:hypothetical protein
MASYQLIILQGGYPNHLFELLPAKQRDRPTSASRADTSGIDRLVGLKMNR